MIKLPEKEEVLRTFVLKKCCYNCRFWKRSGIIPSNAFCEKHEDRVPICGYCPLWQASKHILTVKVLTKKLLER